MLRLWQKSQALETLLNFLGLGVFEEELPGPAYSLCISTWRFISKRALSRILLALRSNSVREENFQLFSIPRFARQLKLIIGFRSCLNAGDSVVDIVSVIGLSALSTLFDHPVPLHSPMVYFANKTTPFANGVPLAEWHAH